MKADWQILQAIALAEIEAAMASLPAPLQAEAIQLPITLEHRPSGELQADGIAPDTLGLFVGAEFAEENNVPMPPQIILFLENLWEDAEENEDWFRDEIRTTLFHELGHFLGLDEEDLIKRGLE